MCVLFCLLVYVYFFFFFNDTATTEIYTLSLHDALPISVGIHDQRPAVEDQLVLAADRVHVDERRAVSLGHLCGQLEDRKSTRLNSSHANISYAVFCLKKKKKLDMQCRGTVPKLTDCTRP